MMFRPLTGRGVLICFLGFFGIVFAGNAVMMWMAAATYDGRASETADRTANAYNRVLEEARAQEALGWRVEIDVESAETVAVSFMDRRGEPIDGLEIAGRFASPVMASEDRAAEVTPLGSGRYRLAADLPRRGNWRLEVEVSNASGKKLRIEKSLFLSQ